jgi:hypothetical protein
LVRDRPRARQLLLKRVKVANLAKSNHNTRILDGGRGKDGEGEEWETRQVAWSGMPEMIRIYAAAVAAAFDIPATRFLGKSPDGMNATGAGDEANYDAKIDADRDAYLRPALDQMDVALAAVRWREGQRRGMVHLPAAQADVGARPLDHLQEPDGRA